MYDDEITRKYFEICDLFRGEFEKNERGWRELPVIAQLVEQRTENPCVPGSIPGDTTSESESYRNVTLFFCSEKWSEMVWKWGDVFSNVYFR